MDPTLSAVAGMMGGMIFGAAFASIAHVADNPYASWLGQECWVHPLGVGEWREHVIVAVSWKGAVCVKRSDRLDQDGYWIKHYNVPKRVRFHRPEVGE